MTLQAKNSLFKDIKALLHNARTQVVKTVNSAMVNTYFEIGRLIIEHEQKGKVKAGYGEEILAQLSSQLTLEFGKGFSETNLKQMRTFYIAYCLEVDDVPIYPWRIKQYDFKHIPLISIRKSGWRRQRIDLGDGF